MKITKNIIVDIRGLKVIPLNLNQILTLLKVKFYSDKELLNFKVHKEDVQYLVDNRYLIVNNPENSTQKYYLREKGKVALDKIISIETKDINSKLVLKDISTKDYIEDFKILVNNFRSKFKGLKLGSMGNPQAVKDKLKRWMKDNPQITHKEILNAVDNYLESLNGDYRFLQRAD